MGVNGKEKKQCNHPYQLSQRVSNSVTARLQDYENRRQDGHQKIQLRFKKPKTYYGRHKESVERWLFHVEQYFIAAQIVKLTEP